MDTKRLRCKRASIPSRRWAAYATAATATLVVGSNSLEAAIHYSGMVNETFPPHKGKLKEFPLDKPGDYFQFGRGKDVLGNSELQLADFSVFGIVSAAFRGQSPTFYNYRVSRLSFGDDISLGGFTKPDDGNFSGVLASHYHYRTQWRDPGIGFVGFKFNSGAGIQYGWVRVKMAGVPANAFKVLDYAFGDPGEPIKAGQKRSGLANEPAAGSLGLLALGATGLVFWRQRRKQSLT